MEQNRQDIDEHLLLQYLQGDADETLISRIEHWLKEDSLNQKHLEQLESLWLESGKISPAPVMVDTEAAWSRMADRIESENQQKIRPDRSIPFRWWWAAALLLLLGGIVLLLMVQMPRKQVQVATGDSVKNFRLPDGSKVILNKHSTLCYPAEFDSGKREITITGEVFFEVRHDSLQPFLVNAGSAVIRVLGTIFRIDMSRAGITEVSVAEGRVSFTAGGSGAGGSRSVILLPGQTGRSMGSEGIPVITDSTNPDGFFWANKTLNFRATELSEVFRIIEKHYQIHIHVENPPILRCRLTGTFSNEPANRLLAVIAESFGLSLRIEGIHIFVSGDGCGEKE